MELIFLGSGATSTDERSASSLAVKTNDSCFIIGCGPDIDKQIKRENIDFIDFVLISDSEECSVGGIPKLRELSEDTISLFMQPKTYHALKKTNVDFDGLKIKLYNPGIMFNVNNIKIMPFSTDGVSAGFNFLDIAYRGGGHIGPQSPSPEEQNADIIISNSSQWFGCDGHTVSDVLQDAKNKKPKQFIITHVDQSFPSHPTAESGIRQYWQEVGGDDSTQIILATDGMRLQLREHVSQILYEVVEGINLASPHGKLIYSGKQKKLLLGKQYRNKINKFVYVIENNVCYGIIRLKTPDKITLSELTELSKEHYVSNQDRIKWWGQKEVFYLYPFDVVELYDSPKKILMDIDTKNDLFVTNFKETDFNLKSINEDDLLIAWDVLSGKYEKPDSICNLNIAKKVHNQLLAKDIIPHNFSEQLSRIMNDSSKDLLDLSVLEEFQDKSLVQNFISIVGNKKEGNINILIRMSEPSEFLKKIIEECISKDVGFSDELNFIWGDPDSPHDTFIPLYDLQIKRVTPLKMVSMKEEVVELKAFQPFTPMKSESCFNNLEKTLKYLFSNETVLRLGSTGNKFAIEKKFYGERVVLMKMGNQITIYSDKKENVSNKYPQILKEAWALTNKNIVIDGQILSDSKPIFHAFDVLQYGDEDLTDKPWFDRKTKLHSLLFKEHIIEVYSIIVSQSDKCSEAIEFMQSLEDSEGVMIKGYNSKYFKDELSSSWITYKNDDSGATTSGTSGIPAVSGKIWIKPGIKGPKKKKNEEDEEEELMESAINNHKFFDKWSGTMAYYLGYLSNDGHLDNKTNRIEFNMETRDASILRKLAGLLGGSISPKVISGYTTLRWKSEDMANTLRKLGMDVKKAGRTTYKKVPAAYKWDYARGAFDADGSVPGDRMQFDSPNRPLAKWMASLWKSTGADVKEYDYALAKVVALGADGRKVHSRIYSGSPAIPRKAATKIKDGKGKESRTS